MCGCDTHPEGTLVPQVQGSGCEWLPSRIKMDGGLGEVRRGQKKERGFSWVCKGGITGALGAWLVHRWVLN